MQYFNLVDTQHLVQARGEVRLESPVLLQVLGSKMSTARGCITATTYSGNVGRIIAKVAPPLQAGSIILQLQIHTVHALCALPDEFLSCEGDSTRGK